MHKITGYQDPHQLSENKFGQNHSIPVPRDILPVPLEAGTHQKCTVDLPRTDEVYYYAIVAVDEAGNRVEVSNCVPIFAEELTTTPTNISDELNMIFQVVTSEQNGDAREALVDNNTIIYLVAAAISAFLLILISIIVVAVCRARKKQKLAAEDISLPIHLPSTTTITHQTGDEYNGIGFSHDSGHS